MREGERGGGGSYTFKLIHIYKYYQMRGVWGLEEGL